MKKLVLAALVTLMTTASFAQESSEPMASSPDTYSSEEATAPEFFSVEQLDQMDQNGINADDVDTMAPRWPRPRPRPRPHAWQCVARNIARQQFWGSDWNQWRARDEAMESCRRTPPFFGCRIVGCYRR